MNNKFFELRERYPVFLYKGFSFEIDNELKIEYDFEIPGLDIGFFKPTWTIPVSGEYDMDILKELIFSLGMTEMISYWKLTCSPQIEVRYGLKTGEEKFFKKLFKMGLGEFFYVNDIEPPEDLIDFKGDLREFILKPVAKNDSRKVLVPIGGGKDSAVTLELLKDFERTGFIINPRGATVATAETAEVKPIICKRTLDKNMLRLNKQGFLNGHTPFSAIVAFSSLIAAYLNDIQYVALSNESSANEPTVLGTGINHQYSKSEEFERDFIEYERDFLGTGVSYFSLLRPLSEIGIASRFANYKKYHSIFKSCNVGSFEDRWCGECAKCLFVYIILSPFLSPDEVRKIFNKDLFEDESLIPLLKELSGVSEVKPFECVGRVDEVNGALCEVLRQYEARGESLPVLLREYKSWNVPNFGNFYDLVSSFDASHHIPEGFQGVFLNLLELI